jgi:hypothetical protein
MSEKTASDLDLELTNHLAGERAHMLPTILLIAEIERRQTFIEQGFSTIWDYLRRVHRQSDTMIHYRVACARAVNRFPQVVPFLRDGSLCMTTLAKLMEVMNDSNCDALIAEALGKSKRDAEKIVAREKPKPVPKDIQRSIESTFPGKCDVPSVPTPVSERHAEVKPLTATVSRVYMNVNQEYLDLLKEMRGELSHKMPGAADFEILVECMRIARRN